MTYISLVILILIGPLIYFISRHPRSASAGWWDDIWHYRVQITVTNSGAADSNKKIKFDIDTQTLITAGKMQADCGDSRFTAENGEELLYYLDSAVGACNTSSTDYYVLVPTIPAGNFNIYHYYGNPSATDGTQSSQFTEATFSPGSTSSAAEEKGTSPIAYWSFDEGYGTTVHNQMEKNGENGLIGWWKMDEGTGSTVADEMGLNNATITGAAWIAGKKGNGLDFESTSNQYVDVGDHENYNQSYITVSAWIKPESLVSGAPFINRRTAANVGGFTFEEYETEGSLRFYIYSGGAWRSTTASNVISAGSWYHVTGTYDGSTIKIYVNGALSSSSSYSGTMNNPSSPTFWIGRNIVTDTIYYDGIIDDVKLYNHALSASEIDSEYRSAHGQMINMSASSDWVGGAQPNSNQKPLGKALDFDGSDDYLSVSDNATLDFNDTADLSLSAWIKPTSQPGVIIAKRSASTNDTGYLLEIDSNGYLTLLVADGSDEYSIASSTTINMNVWTYVIVVFDQDSATNCKLYINGVENAGATKTGTLANIGDLSNSNDLRIGSEVGATSNKFSGQIDEVKIYDFALSAAQVKVQYNRGTSAALDVGINVNIGATGPVGYWKLDEGSAYTAFDSSGNNKNGTLTNGPTWTNGKVGKALSFDGVDDYVPITTSTTGIMGSAFTSATAEAWVYLTGTPSSESYVFGDGTTDGWIVIGVNTSKQPFVKTREVLTPYPSIYATSDTALSLNTWYHITGIIDASNLYLYVNGVYNTSNTHAGICIVDNDGVRINNGTFPGKIDHVKIYNYTRTIAQIHYDMATGSPVSYWRFDEGYGGTAYDEQKNNNGALGADSSAPSWANGAQGNPNQKPLGKSLSFDGSDDYANVPTSSSLTYDGTTAWTMEAWIKPNDNGNTQMILSKSYDLSSHYQYAMSISDSGSNFTAWVGSHVNPAAWRVSCTTDTTYSYGVWHHIVGILGQETNNSYIYVDGVLAKTCATTAGVVSSAYDLKIGREERADYPFFFNGSIDNAKIYNYALAADEIKVEYNRGAALALGVGQNASDPGSDNLKAWWKMDEATGTSAYDISGNANTGTFAAGSSAPTWAQGKKGKALSFDGSDDYVIVADTNNSLDLTGNFTIEAWLYIDSLPTSGNLKSIAAKWESNTGWDLRLYNSSGTQKIGFGIDGVAMDTSYTLPTSQWIHFVGIHNATNDIDYFYLNGVQIASITSSTTDAPANAVDTVIGRLNSTYGRYFDGQIDNVKIYNSALTAAQIAWEYNQGKPLAHWRLDEKSDVTAYDDSDNNYDATLTLMDSSTDWVAGKFNGALDFDGTDDRLVLPDFGFAESYPFTISGWFKTSKDYVDSVVIFQGRYTGSNNPAVFCGLGATEVAGYSLRNDAGTITEFNGTTLLNDGLWHQISCVAEAANSHKLYVDGKLENSSTTNVTTPITLNLYNVGAGYYLGSYYYHLQGQIDEVKLYNYGLTADQIKVDYNNGAAVKY